MAAPQPFAPHPFAVANFRAYWVSRLAATLGQLAMIIVIGWQAYDIARETMGIKAAAFQLGLIGLAEFLPLLALSLVGGWVADRVDRRWIARASVTLLALCAASLGWLTWSGSISLPWLFGISALLGVSRAFAAPALGALAPNLVPKETLPAAIALSALAWQIGTVVGPAMGGYLYAAIHWLPYAVSTGLFLLSLAMLMLIGPVPRPPRGTGNPWQQMAEGLRYVRRNRLVLGAISLDLFAVLLGGATAMLPVYARDILQVGADGLGHLRAAPAVGAVAVAAFGLGTIVFGLAGPLLGPSPDANELAPAVLLSLAALVVLGASDMVSVYIRQSLIQLYTPDEMRGRVGAVSTLFISGSNELGEAESGFLAAAIGPVAAVVGGGVGAVLVTMLWAKLFPELRQARTFDPPETIEFVPKETAT